MDINRLRRNGQYPFAEYLAICHNHYNVRRQTFQLFYTVLAVDIFGCHTGKPFAKAHSFTGGIESFRWRPATLSGLVIINSGKKFALSIAANVVQAKSEVPIKIILAKDHSSPLTKSVALSTNKIPARWSSSCCKMRAKYPAASRYLVSPRRF